MAPQERLANPAIAERLDSFATLLELADASPYALAAYRRAAELIRATKAPVADLIRTGRVRELRGIGPGIEGRLRELVERGELAELEELERRVAPGLVGLGRYLGIGVRRAALIAQTLGVRTAADLAKSGGRGAAARRARNRRADGGAPPRRPRAGGAAPGARSPPPARAAARRRDRRALGGVAAGDPRRYRDTSEHLAVVVAADDPAATLDAFGGLAAIVSVLDRSERQAYGVTVEGVPVELLVPPPAAFGTALVRATGSREYVAALEPLPRRRTRRRSTARWASHGARRSSASSRSAGSRRRWPSSAGSAAINVGLLTPRNRSMMPWITATSEVQLTDAVSLMVEPVF